MQASPQCHQCNATVDPADAFCAECGVRLDKALPAHAPFSSSDSHCPSCKAMVPTDSAFCHECGQAIEAAGPTSQRAQQMDYSSVNFCLRLLAVGKQEIQLAYNDPEGGLSVSMLKMGRYELGLILTDLGKVRDKLGTGYHSFQKTLQEYLSHSIRAQRAYFLLDVSENIIGKFPNPNWRQVVNLIKEANGFLRQEIDQEPTSIFILGDDEVIPMARFPNQINMDPDREVETDLIYSTLAEEDPWQKAKTALVPQLHVGRLPIGKNFGAEKFAHYLGNIYEKSAHPPEVSRVTGISAKVWESASQAMYSRLGGGFVKTSPKLELKNVMGEINLDAPIQYYNLHGTDTDEFWYGEFDLKYPRTFSPELAGHMTTINAIGVEACYGAKFIGCQEANSILMRSLSQCTLGFLGSSKIAFGPPAPPNSLADIIVGEFLIAIQDGNTFGQATNLARQATLRGGLLDGLVVKTLLSFNLFGDPMERLLDKGLPLSQLNIEELRVSIPDIFQEVRESLIRAKINIVERVRPQLKVGIPEMSEIEPVVQRCYLASLKKEVNCMYFSSPGFPTRLAIAYADDEGHVLGEFLTK